MIRAIVESVVIRPPTPSLDPPADGDDFRRNRPRNHGIRGQGHLDSAKIASDDAEGPNGHSERLRDRWKVGYIDRLNSQLL